MSEKSFDDVAFDKLVAVNSNLIDETKPTARFFELRSAHRDCSLIDALSDAFPAVFVEDVNGCNPTYWNVGGYHRDPATMPEVVLRWYVLRALRKDTDADPADYIDDYNMFASTTALCEKLIEELEYNHEYEDSVVCDPETGEFMFDYDDPDFGEDAPETIDAAAREQLLSNIRELRDKGYQCNSYNGFYAYAEGEDAPETVVAAREQLLSKLRDKGYKFNSYNGLYEYVEQLDERTYSILDSDVLDDEEYEFLELDEVRAVLDDIYWDREYEAIKRAIEEAATESGTRINTSEIGVIRDQRKREHYEDMAKFMNEEFII